MKKAAFPDGHFYSPVTDTSDLERREEEIWVKDPVVLGVEFNTESHIQILEEWFPKHFPKYDYPELPEESSRITQFHTRNSQFSWLDARALFVLLNEWKPRRMIEVGSGFSSLLSADVNHRFLDNSMHFTCIDPYPREFLKQAIPGITDLVFDRVEYVPHAVFESLGAGDVLFIDSTHVAKTGSDVNYLMFDILPRLRVGVKIHFHDIFLPREYPRDWVIEQNRSWNEQYVLRALLMYSSAFRIVFGCSYAYHAYPDLVARALKVPKHEAFGGGSLWIERMGC